MTKQNTTTKKTGDFMTEVAGRNRTFWIVEYTDGSAQLFHDQDNAMAQFEDALTE